jgi:hypothetical protein
MKMEQTQRSETLAFKLQTPENSPEESILHSKNGENFKSRIYVNGQNSYSRGALQDVMHKF